MTTTDNELTALRARSEPHLIRLALPAGSPPGTPLPAGAATEVAEATGAVLAQAGDAAALRACLRQFEALTTALWTVHEAVIVPAPGRRSAAAPARWRTRRTAGSRTAAA